MWIEIFRTGTQMDSAGVEKEWSEAELQAMATKYNDQSEHEAPIVVGHAKNNEPAYGWVDKLKQEGSKLFASLKQVDTKFKELVNKGRYKTVSMALYPDMLLRHVAFLGAVPPAVKGLKPVEFAEDKEFTEYEIASEPGTINFGEKIEFADVEQKKFPIGTELETGASLAAFNKKEVQKNYSEAERQTIASKLLLAARGFKINLTPTVWTFAEVEVAVPISALSKKQIIDEYIKKNNNSLTNKPKEFSMNENYKTELLQWIGETFTEEIAAQISAQLEILDGKYPPVAPVEPVPPAAEEPQFSEREKAMQYRIEKLESQQKQAQHQEFAEGIIKDGKLLPAQKPMLMELMNQSKDGEFEFSENDKTEKLTSLSLLQKFVNSYPDQLTLKEFAEGENVTNKPVSTFKLPKGDFIVDEAMELQHSKALQFMEEQGKANVKVTYLDAVKHITEGA